MDRQSNKYWIERPLATKAIVEKIVERGGDYALALKGNQRTLAQAVEESFTDADAVDYDGWPMDFHETSERGHGRVETRRYRTLTAEGNAGLGIWKRLKYVICAGFLAVAFVAT